LAPAPGPLQHWAAAAQDKTISAVVSRGGRADLAIRHLPRVRAPTLLIVGGHDYGVIELTEKAYRVLSCEKSLKIVPGATHLFEQPGALEMVAELAGDWFTRYLKVPQNPDPPTLDPIVDRCELGGLRRGSLRLAGTERRRQKHIDFAD
jgi:alpha-beta hydrolase superfamily lysophospholipase